MALIFPHLFPGLGLAGPILIGGCTGIFVIIPVWMISKKAGFSPWLSLLFIVPLAGLLYLWYLGFAEWPSLRGEKAGSGADGA